MPSQQAFLTIPAELAKRLLAELEEDCDRMEAAAATIEALTELAGSQPDELVTQSVASREITKRDAQ